MKRPQLPLKQFSQFSFARFSKAGGWRLSVIAGFLAIAAMAVLYGFRLSALIGPAQGELQSMQQLAHSSGLINNPLGAPFKLLAYAYLKLPGDPLLQVRLAAVSLSLVNIGLFMLLARRWYGSVNGMTATVLFAASGWALQTGRYGAGYAAFTLMLLALLNLVVWINNTDQAGRAVLVYAAVGGGALFVPAGVWFVIAATALSYPSLMSHIRRASARQLAIAAVVAVLLLSGLLQALVRDSSLVRQWLGLPQALPGIVQLGKQAAHSGSAFVVRGPATPEVWLSHTPLLDVASSALLVLGVIFYSRHLGNSRTRLLLSFAAIGVVLTALNGSPALSYLVPVVYLVLAGGLAFFLHQWKKVFPRNPFASATALVLLGILVLSIIGYHAQRYFVAWRYSPDTISTYQAAEPKLPTGNHQLPYLLQ